MQIGICGKTVAVTGAVIVDHSPRFAVIARATTVVYPLRTT